MVEQEIAMKMPKGTPAELSIKDLDGDDLEVSCQGSIESVSGVIFLAMEHPIIMASVLSAAGAYLEQNGDSLAAGLISVYLIRNGKALRAKMDEVMGEKEEVES